jgi:hypothetical protein
VRFARFAGSGIRWPQDLSWHVALSNSRKAVRFFIGMHNKPLSIVAMRVNNPNRSSIPIHG